MIITTEHSNLLLSNTFDWTKLPILHIITTLHDGIQFKNYQYVDEPEDTYTTTRLQQYGTQLN